MILSERKQGLASQGKFLGGARTGQGEHAWGSQPSQEEEEATFHAPCSGLAADLPERKSKPPTPPALRHRPFKQKPVGWHAWWVSQRALGADSPTGNLLLPWPAPHTGN